MDTGLLRLDERQQVEQAFHQNLGTHLVVVDAVQETFGRLKGVTEPELKRRIIGENFIRIFEEQARRLGIPALPGAGHHLSGRG